MICPWPTHTDSFRVTPLDLSPHHQVSPNAAPQPFPRMGLPDMVKTHVYLTAEKMSVTLSPHAVANQGSHDLLGFK